MRGSDSPRAVSCIALSRGFARLPVSIRSAHDRFQPSPVSRFLLRASIAICHGVLIGVRAGANGVSRVHDASLVTCRRLRTPPALLRLTNAPGSFRFHVRYNADPSGTAFRSDTHSQGLLPQTAYNIPCVRFTFFVRVPSQKILSADAAPSEAQHSVVVGG
jgi:hypothetical protein